MLVNRLKFNNSLKKRNNCKGSMRARMAPYLAVSKEYASMTQKLKLHALFTALSKPRNNYKTSWVAHQEVGSIITKTTTGPE